MQNTQQLQNLINRSVKRKSEIANTFFFYFCCKGTQAILETEEFEDPDWIIEILGSISLPCKA